MIQYDTLYSMLIIESVRYITGAWEDTVHNEEDMQELIHDISKCFYDDKGNYSSTSSAVRETMKSLEIVQNPTPDKILILRNIIISVLFSTKYDVFPTPGDMYTAFEGFRNSIYKDTALLLKKNAGLSDLDCKSIKQDGVNSPAIGKLNSLITGNKEIYLNHCIKFISCLDL